MSKSTNISKVEMVKAIATHEVFKDLQPSALLQLQEIVTLKSVKENEALFKIGDQPNSIFYLLDGSLTLYFPDNTKLDLQPGELIGEIGFLNGDFRLGTLKANLDSQLIAICGTRILNPAYVNTDISLTIVRRLSRRVTNYLKSLQQTSTEEIIRSGENDQVEFKSTLRWNLKANKKDKAITHSILKTVAAFLNSDGGILLVGVEDNGDILGLEEDRFENEDKMLLFLTDTIKSKLGALHMSQIHFHTEEVSGKTVLRLDIKDGEAPCYLTRENDERFYIRTGPSTTELKTSKIYTYIKRRFYNQGKSVEQ